MDKPTRRPTQWSVAQPVPVGWMRQFRYMSEMFDLVKGIEGDVVECGLGEGNTFSMLAYFIGRENHNPARVLWGFDSFQGFPEPTVYDQSPRNPQKGEWGDVSQGMVEERLEQSLIRKEFPDMDIRIIPGYVDKTLPDFPDRPIAFLHLDVDLYSGYHAGLTHLFPKIAGGGVILFDEYREFSKRLGAEKFPGATKAVDDYFANLPYQIQEYPETKKFFVIKNKQAI